MFLGMLLAVTALGFAGYGAYWVLEKQEVGDDAQAAAYSALNNELGRVPRHGTLLLVDFSHPSQSRRFRMIDLGSKKIHFDSRVAHGLNSGGVFARDFSNIVNSYQSSLGLFEVGERYEGKHGWSLRLDGLDELKNSKARERAIIIHKGDYVDYGAMLENWNEGFRLGRSLGCFVLTPERYSELESKMVRPAYLYAYR